MIQIELSEMGFDIYVDNRSKKCTYKNSYAQYKNLVDYRPKENPCNPERVSFSECARLCYENAECNFFFFNVAKYCELYRNCHDSMTTPGNFGLVYQKGEYKG